MKACIFGVEPDEVRDFLDGIDERPELSEDFPVIRVDCPDEASARALVDRFGDNVYSLYGASLAQALGASLLSAGWKLAVAESCTGGLIGHLVTGVAGSSAWFLGGYVTYSNSLKAAALGVPRADIQEHGAVSREVVEAMAYGAMRAASADVAVAVSGIAGPGGGTPDKPVGTVWLAVATDQGVRSLMRHWPAERSKVKMMAAHQAMDLARRAALGAGLK